MTSPKDMEQRWLIVWMVFALATGIIAGRFTSRERPAPSVAASAKDPQAKSSSSVRFQIPISDSQPSLGPAGALVTIVEWSDVRCTQCATAETAVESLRKQYGDALRVVWRNQVQQNVPDALAAADFAMEAHTQAGKFWQALPLLRAQKAPLSEADLLGYARQLGLDERGVKAALQQQSHRVHIVNDGVFAGRFGVRTLPAFFINGVPFEGPQTQAGFAAAIQPELQRAKSLVAGGIAPENIYAELTKGGLWNVPDWKNPALAR